MSGMDLPLAVMITIPAPWEHDRYMRQEIKDFYRYYATMMEPWDARHLSCSQTARSSARRSMPRKVSDWSLTVSPGKSKKMTDTGPRFREVYTAGDMRRGQFLVVWAIREGRNAAREVDEDLMGYSNLGAAE